MGAIHNPGCCDRPDAINVSYLCNIILFEVYFLMKNIKNFFQAVRVLSLKADISVCLDIIFPKLKY